jgi:hypothetical protein
MNRLIVIGALGLLLVLAILFGVRQCDERRSQAAQSKVERSQADAASNSAADAIGTVANAGEREAASEDLTRSNDRTIRNAPGANQTVDPRAADAGLRALCLRRAYSADPKCKLLGTSPK